MIDGKGLSVHISEWHICISGFQQQSSTLNGITKIWLDLIELTQCRPDARVELLAWNDNIPNIAELISKVPKDNASPLVNLYGYSWGGQSAVNLARELRRRGVDVNHLVLSDAVYRHWFWLGDWRVLSTAFPITVPDNVRKVTWFRQSECFPRGHNLVAANPTKTAINEPVVLTTEHKWMDDSSQFRAACREACQSVV